jgi:hypothetical protein
MKDTQRESYEDLKLTVGEKQNKVRDMIVLCGGLTLFELVDKLKWPINCISGRVTELCKMGLIMDSGIRHVNPATNKKAILWRPADPSKKQMDLI